MPKPGSLNKFVNNTTANADEVNPNFVASAANPVVAYDDDLAGLMSENFEIGSETARTRGSLLNILKIRETATVKTYDINGNLIDSTPFDEIGGTPDGFLYGLRLDYNNSSLLTLKKGLCKSYDNDKNLILNSDLTKTVSKWQEGNSNGSFLGYANIKYYESGSPSDTNQSNMIDKDLNTYAVLNPSTIAPGVFIARFNINIAENDQVKVKINCDNITNLYLTERDSATVISNTIDLTATTGVQTLTLNITQVSADLGFTLAGLINAGNTVDVYEIIPLWYNISYVQDYDLQKIYPYIIRKTDGSCDLLLTNRVNVIDLILPFTPSVENTYETYRKLNPNLNYRQSVLVPFETINMNTVMDIDNVPIPYNKYFNTVCASSGNYSVADYNVINLIIVGGGGGGASADHSASVQNGFNGSQTQATVDSTVYTATGGGGGKYLGAGGFAGSPDGKSGFAGGGANGQDGRDGYIVPDYNVVAGNAQVGYFGNPAGDPGKGFGASGPSGGRSFNGFAGGSGGSGGILIIENINVSAVDEISVVIGAGGAGGNGAIDGGNGTNGVVIIEGCL